MQNAFSLIGIVQRWLAARSIVSFMDMRIALIFSAFAASALCNPLVLCYPSGSLVSGAEGLAFNFYAGHMGQSYQLHTPSDAITNKVELISLFNDDFKVSTSLSSHQV